MATLRMLILAATSALLLGSQAFAQVPASPILVDPNSPAPTGYPTAATTGVPTGVTLSPCNGSLTTAGATYDRCLFSSGVNVRANNVTITRSKVVGVVTGDYSDRNFTMIDVEIDGNNSSLDATNGLHDYTCRRCKVHNAAKCFTGHGFTVEDSYCYDLYGSGSSHNEPVLGSGTDQIILRNNNLVANWNSATSGGGMSAVIALYSHTSFWGPLDNVLMDNNRLENRTGAVYCVYGGNSTDHDPTNIRFTNNVYVGGPTGGCKNPIAGWRRDATNVWSNNGYDTGQAILEPSGGNYN